MARSNPNVLYTVVQTGGVFKTIDKGLNWTLVYDRPAVNPGSSYPVFSGLVFGTVAVHPTDADHVLVGKGSLVARSNDGGNTWTESTPACGGVNTIEFNPSNGNEVIISTDNGIWRSVDGGTLFTRVATNTNSWFCDVNYNTANNNIVYALRHDNNNQMVFLTSTDGGQTFANLTVSGWPTTTNNASGRFTVTAANSNVIYVVLITNVTRVYKSIDGGLNWVSTAVGGVNGCDLNNGQGYYDLDILAHPTNADLVLLGTSTAWRSSDGGVTWIRKFGYIAPIPTHEDIQELITNGVDTWAATDGGVNLSSDFFDTNAGHSVRNNGIFGTEYWGYGQGWNEDISGGGSYHNGNRILSEDFPAGQAMFAGGVESGTGNYLYGKPRHMVFDDIGGGGGIVIPRQISGSSTRFQHKLYPIPGENGYSPSDLEFSPIHSNVVYAGRRLEFVRSNDGGLTFTTIATLPHDIRRFEIARSNIKKIYLATTDNFYKSADGGYTFTQITLPPLTSLNRAAVEVDALDENKIWLGGSAGPVHQKILYSADGGATWTRLYTATLGTQSMQGMFHQQGTNGGVYWVGHAGNVYYRNSSMADWVLHNNGIPKSTQVLIAMPFYRDSKIKVAGNRGVWEAKFYERSLPIAQPMANIDTLKCLRDSVRFEDFSILDHQGATWAWSFPGASYVSSTSIINPVVKYNTPGSYDVTLTITDGQGQTSTKTINNMIFVPTSTPACMPDTIRGNVMTIDGCPDCYRHAQFNLSPKFAKPKSQFSFSAWVKPNGVQQPNATIFYIEMPNGNRLGLTINGGGTSTSTLGYWHPAFVDGAGNYVKQVVAGLDIKYNEWNHVAWIARSSGMTFAVNGRSVSVTRSNPLVDFGTKVVMGLSVSADWTHYFKGDMDEVCFYDTSFVITEFRNMMHLTKNNPHYASQYNGNLTNYYQFNDQIFPGTSVDKAGVEAIVLNGAVKTNVSTAPVGGGIFESKFVSGSTSTAASYDYTNLGFKIAYKVGVKPNGLVVGSKVYITPDVSPGSTPFNTEPNYQYIITNGATNLTFAGTDSVVFYDLPEIKAAAINRPARVQLFKRPSYAHGNTWGAYFDTASITSNENGVGKAVFTNSMTSFSQFAFGFNTVLPISLIDFSATLQQKKVLLEWSVGFESNNKQFEIQRSTDGINWTTILTIPSRGNTSTKQVYSATDFSPMDGINFYRLRQIDFDGKSSTSAIRSVLLNDAGSKVKLFPNPGSSVVQMQAGRMVASSDIVIYDVLGKNVSQQVGIKMWGLQGTFLLNIEQLPKGVYFVQAKGERATLIKQ